MIGRSEAVATILKYVTAEDLVLGTTGMISRELFNAGDRAGNFYMLGSMGLLSAFALGLALLSPGRRVIAIEGDGSALMDLGTLPLIATEGPRNLVHVILDNEAYESTGAQPSISGRVDLAEIGRRCGYRQVSRCEDQPTLATAISGARIDAGPSLVVAKTNLVVAHEVPRVSRPATEIRDTFRKFVEQRS